MVLSPRRLSDGSVPAFGGCSSTASLLHILDFLALHTRFSGCTYPFCCIVQRIVSFGHYPARRKDLSEDLWSWRFRRCIPLQSRSLSYLCAHILLCLLFASPQLRLEACKAKPRRSSQSLSPIQPNPFTLPQLTSSPPESSPPPSSNASHP